MDQQEQINAHNRKFGWIILAAVAIAGFLFRGLHRSIGILFIELRTVYDTDSKTIAAIIGLIGSSDQFSALIVSIFVMTFQPRISAIVGASLIATGLLISAFTYDINILYFSLGAMMGIGISFCDISSIVILSYYFLTRPTIAQGLRLSGVSLGSAVIPFAFVYFLEIYGVHGTFLISAGLILNILPCALLYIPSKELPVNSVNENNLTKEDSAISASSSKKQVDVDILHKPTLEELSDFETAGYSLLSQTKITCVKCYDYFRQRKEVRLFLLLLSQAVFYTYVYMSATFVTAFRCLTVILPAHTEVTTQSKIHAGYILTILSINDLIGRFTFGWIVDGLQLNRRYCYAICCLLVGIAVQFIPLFEAFSSLAIYICFCGLLLGCASPILIPLYIDAFGREFLAPSRGLEGFFSGCFNMLTMFCIGILVDAYDNFKIAFNLVGSVFISSSLALTFLYPCAKHWDSRRTLNITPSLQQR